MILSLFEVDVKPLLCCINNINITSVCFEKSYDVLKSWTIIAVE